MPDRVCISISYTHSGTHTTPHSSHSSPPSLDYAEDLSSTSERAMAQPAMEKPPHPTDRPQPETTSLEGYLEYAQPISPDPSRASTGPPVSHGDETRIPAADDPAQPTTDVTDQTDREREVLLNLPIWKKRTLFCCSCALQFLLQFDMAAVAAALHVRRLPRPLSLLQNERKECNRKGEYNHRICLKRLTQTEHRTSPWTARHLR